MHKSYLLFAALTVCGSIWAQDDVTSSYVSNASFESNNISALQAVNNNGLRGYTVSAPESWTVSGSSVTSLIVTADCYSDNNFGQFSTIADGTQAYYLRMGWSNGSTTLQQTLKSLPAGNWQLSAKVKTGYANSATSSYQLFAGDNSTSGSFVQGSEGFMPSNAWTTVSVRFSTTSTQDVNVGLTVDWLSGGSCIAIDDVRLEKVSGEITPAEEPTEADVSSLTEGVITSAFVGESDMKDGLLTMLGKFATYLKNDFQQAQAPNSVGEACGCFKSNSTMQANEDGVRSNVDLGMIAAFLAKYGPGKVTLPEGVTWDDINDMAMKSLVFAYSTHKANKLKVCSGNAYWGSVSNSDHTWESSLWAMGVAYSAFFQWDKLSDAQKGYVKALLKAECNYELERSIPTNYAGDTKAEENGWEADVLAATLGLFPDDELAPKWFDRLREFAINSYSHISDKDNTTVIDPDYDSKTIADLYKGQNLYDDYTLQNHNYFHTSYQNVVIQELGEAALALKLFQTQLYGTEKWKTNALMHHNEDVQKQVLNWLALADGELAMPNGNDWSLFLYDQITSYTTNATFLGDADALMLENLAYKMIQARQQTTEDGSWLLRSDIGARRMGVEAHRVMMTWLMHEVNSTADLQASDFEQFRERYDSARLFSSQNLVRAYNKDRFTTFAWQPGISSYTGYIAANSVDKNKIIVPYKANNTGNFLGWYTVEGKNTNASPVVSGIYQIDGTAWTMNGELSTNDASLDNRFAIYSTPGNAVIYLDYVSANQSATVSREQGGLMAISTDELTRLKRTLYYGDTHRQLDGTSLTTINSSWVNIDNALGVVAHNGKRMAFGDRSNNNSIMTSKLYSAYDATSRSYKAGERVDARNVVYYSNISADDTRKADSMLVCLRDSLPEGWNGVIAADPDGSRYLLLSNFMSNEKAQLKGITTAKGAPVFSVRTSIDGGKSSASFSIEQNNSVAMPLQFFIDGSGVEAIAKGDSAYVKSADGSTVTMTVNSLSDSYKLTINGSNTALITISGGKLKVEDTTDFPSEPAENLTAGYQDISAMLANPNFEEDETYGDAGSNVTASGTTYETCYINKVNAADSKWPNVLPVKGWTADSRLSGGSNYCRMYSMPYSSTQFCVSPSNVGNYADRMSPMISDDSCKARTLTVLNSWDTGSNAVSQSVSLPAGTYRLLMNVRYVCTNQQSADGRTVTASNGNVNASLTGLAIGSTTDYRYPSEPNQWQTLVWDFTLDSEQDVTLSCGFRTSVSCGAANNTLLYIDHVRLLRQIPTGIAHTAVTPASADGNIYNVAGQRVSPSYKGIVIVNGKKELKN